MKDLKYDQNGLLTGIVQDAETRQVLMVAMMNAEAVRLTLEKKLAHFWSRSRQSLWLKGETSGNILEVQEVLADCDSDALLLLVKPAGPACHTSNRSCFFTELEVEHAD
jgi:phosphoribosyl-AMP cyclohydrolase